MGLVVFAAIGLYLVLAIFVVTSVIRDAKKLGKSTYLWGWGAALVLYLIPFWDLLPTLATKHYQCANNAGFFVSKSVDQWKIENPEVMETLSIAHLPEEYRVPLGQSDYSSDGQNKKYRMPDGTTFLAYFNARNELMYVEYKSPNGEAGYRLNERFRYILTSQGPGAIKLSREEYVVFDSVKNEVMARQIDFRTATKGKIWSTLSDSGWKFWFQSYDTCYKNHPQKFPNGGIHKYIDSLRTDCTPERQASTRKDGIAVACR